MPVPFPTHRVVAGAPLSALGLSFLIVFVLALGTSPAAAIGGPAEKFSIENSRLRVTVSKLAASATSTKGAIVVDSIEDLATNTVFNSLFGSIFSVELRSLTDPSGFPPVTVPPAPVDPIIRPLDSLLVTKPTSSSLQLSWSAIPVPASGQKIDAVVTIALRPDLKSEWDVSVSVTPGPYAVYAVRFPRFAMTPIGADGADDRLMTPFSSGMVLSNPVANGNPFPERDPATEGSVSDALFTYPGSTFSQFMAYYEDKGAAGADTPGTGLYLQAEDPSGYIKNLYFGAANSQRLPAQRRMYWHFTHFNTSPTANSGDSDAERDLARRTFSLTSKLGYPIVVDTFRGDWVDASRLYRDWLASASPTFLARGPLAERPEPSPDAHVVPWAIRYQFDASAPGIDLGEETENCRRILRFYRAAHERFDPAAVYDLEPIVLASRYGETEEGDVMLEVASDDFAAPLRRGVKEWLRDVRFPPAGEPAVDSVALNQDTTGFATSGAVEIEATRSGVKWTSRLEPMAPKPGWLRACIGSQWLVERRASLVIEGIRSSSHGGDPGFTMAGLSGTGNFAFPCFATAIGTGAVDHSLHSHLVGGGDFMTRGWADLASRIRGRALAEFGIEPVLMGMEHEPETAVSDYVLNGRSFVTPYDDATPGIGRTLPRSEPVPLFKFLYHDYNLWTARIPPAAAVVAMYVDGAHPLEDLLYVRLRTAQLAMMGRLLLVQFSQDPAFLPYEAPPDAAPVELRDEHEYTAALTVLRVALADYLVDGKALRDPVVVPASGADTVPLRTILQGVERIDAPPRIVASAWVDAYDSVTPALFLTNYTPDASTASLRFRPSEYGLDPALSYRLQRRGLATAWADVPGSEFSGAATSVTTPSFLVAPLEDVASEPWVILRIVPL